MGKRRLATALASWNGPAEIVWRPFELNPAMPKAGMLRADYRKAKFGSLDRSRELEQRVADAGRSVGLAFEFGKIERTPNTFDGHRLMWLAGASGKQDALAEELFRDYFIEGRDLGDRAGLEAAAARAGVDARGFLESERGVKEVRDEETQGLQLGVQGVPFFVFGGKVGLSGAHEPATILEAIRQAS